MAYAEMGGVLYRLPHSVIPKGFNIAFGGRNNATIIRFENGSLRPAASRESFSMDDQTRELITQTIKEKVDEVLKDTQDEIDKCTNTSQAIRVLGG